MTTIDAQIAELKREIALRKAVYPGFVARGKLKQESSDRQIANMIAALHTVMAVKRLRATMVEHEGDIHDCDLGLLKAKCSCGWEGEHQDRRGAALESYTDHVFERSKADASQ